MSVLHLYKLFLVNLNLLFLFLKNNNRESLVHIILIEITRLETQIKY